MGQQNQIAALAHIQAVDDFLVKRPADFAVLQLAGAQSGEHPVFVAVHHLLGGENHVDQIFPLRAGQRLFQQSHVKLRFLLRHPAQGFVQVRYDLLGRIDKTAVNTADAVFFRLPAAAQFVDFFLVHNLRSLALLLDCLPILPDTAFDGKVKNVFCSIRNVEKLLGVPKKIFPPNGIFRPAPGYSL